MLYTRKLLEIIVKKIRLPVPYKSIDPSITLQLPLEDKNVGLFKQNTRLVLELTLVGLQNSGKTTFVNVIAVSVIEGILRFECCIISKEGDISSLIGYGYSSAEPWKLVEQATSVVTSTTNSIPQEIITLYYSTWLVIIPVALKYLFPTKNGTEYGHSE